jgi:large subunit ribosomal protein L25
MRARGDSDHCRVKLVLQVKRTARNVVVEKLSPGFESAPLVRVGTLARFEAYPTRVDAKAALTSATKSGDTGRHDGGAEAPRREKPSKSALRGPTRRHDAERTSSSSGSETTLRYTWRPEMAGERVKLKVQARESRGSAASRRLRAQGLIPGVLYGNGGDAHPFTIEERELRRVLTGEHGLHAILDVVLEDGGQKAHHAVLKDYQLDPTRPRLLHIDLQEVRLDQAIHTQVVVEIVGESEGQKEGGALSQINREVHVEALPMEVPDRLELDVSRMVIGDTLRVSDLRVPEGVKLLDDLETVLVTVTPPTRVEEPEVPEEELEEGELPEGEIGEGEEAPEGAAEQPAEPEADAAGEEQNTEG